MQLPAEKSAIAQGVSEGKDQSIALLPLAEDLEKFAQQSSDGNMAALALDQAGRNAA